MSEQVTMNAAAAAAAGGGGGDNQGQERGQQQSNAETTTQVNDLSPYNHMFISAILNFAIAHAINCRFGYATCDYRM